MQVRVLQDALGGSKYTGYELSFAVTTAAHLRRLNRRHTGEDASTDVLSFAIEHDRAEDDPFAVLNPSTLLATPFLDASGSLVPASEQDLPNDLGSIFVSTEHIIAHARLKHFAPADYLLAVAAHGVAHLVGHRHDTEEQISAMQAAESAALAELYATNSAWCDQHPSPITKPRNMPVSYLP